MCLNQENAYEMSKVSAVVFVQHKTGWYKKITQHYVGLMYSDGGLYISFRKISDLNKEIFTVKL